MGACYFTTKAKGATAKEAFATARSHAMTYYGLQRYTGSIAEKDSFVMIPTPADHPDLEAYAGELSGDPRVDDKWGPAGCIDMRDGHYLFFGWASE